MLGRDIAYMRAKFDNSSFSRSGDMVGTHHNFNGSRDLPGAFHKSAITDHVCNENHVIDWENAKVVDRESDKANRFIREAIWIPSKLIVFA